MKTTTFKRVFRSVAIGLGAVTLTAFWASAAWASGGETDAGIPWGDVSEALVNFALFIGLLYYFGKKPLVKYFKQRSEGLRNDIAEAGRLRKEAEELLSDYSSRLDKFDQERATILEGYRREGARERDEILAAAKEHAERLREDATVAIQYDLKEARQALQERIIEEAVSLAKKRIEKKLDKETNIRLVDEYIGALADVEDHARG